MPLDEAALIEPLPVAVHAVKRAGEIKPRDVAVVAVVGGAGPIGLLTGAVLHAKAATVTTSKLSQLRRQKL